MRSDAFFASGRQAALMAGIALFMSGCAGVGSGVPDSPLCWVEFARGDAPGALGAAGATAAVWHNTTSGLLVRHPSGNVLIDAGWSAAAAQEMDELHPMKAAVARRVLGSLAWRTNAPQALGAASITPQELRYIIPTHGHYDHMAGAVDLPHVPVLLSAAERGYLQVQAAQPDIVPASNIRALAHRMQTLEFATKPFLGFERSFDLYGDGSIVIVPLAGHTPGSVGVFIHSGERRIFHVGDAAFVNEAIARSLPKSAALRTFADHDPLSADAQVVRLAEFARTHPQYAMLPAHDRTAWQAIFGDQPGCR
ncbi:MAG: MBL fold metallo-hydrolase [Polaromonas sp.]|uniref:MBL fold metallo-hydrolase n=1 Tax=Polaromonas sp. TaxID=1869339 RepID=UPI00181F2323|nr:MBL fold metallo-hydrolase [Polaromonas sp.]MBA3592945.1 MBL fold metallo-hydrolase [Polaromonas sp.]